MQLLRNCFDSLAGGVVGVEDNNAEAIGVEELEEPLIAMGLC